MLHKATGIVLHYYKYGESSIIVHIYTDNFGRISCLVNNVRTKKSKLKLVVFQPLSIININFYFKENREIHRIRDVKNDYIFQSVQSDIVKSAIAIFIAEILHKTLKEEEPNPQLFSFLIHAIKFLDVADRGIGNFHLLFLMQFSRYLGIYPERELLSHAESDSIKYKYLLDLCKLSFKNLDSIGYSKNVKSDLLTWIIDHYQTHLGGIGPIKSINVLKEVFN